MIAQCNYVIFFFGFFGSEKCIHGTHFHRRRRRIPSARAYAGRHSDGSDSDDTPTFVRLEDENSDDDPEWEDAERGARPPSDACERGGNAEALSALLGSLNVSVDTKARTGTRRCTSRVCTGTRTSSERFVETNADPRVTDGDGGTPLHDRAREGREHRARPRVERSAKRDEDDVSSFVNARDGDGETPRTWRLEASTVRWLRSCELARRARGDQIRRGARREGVRHRGRRARRDPARRRSVPRRRTP